VDTYQTSALWTSLSTVSRSRIGKRPGQLNTFGNIPSYTSQDDTLASLEAVVSELEQNGDDTDLMPEV
jgi:hypothetical protein